MTANNVGVTTYSFVFLFVLLSCKNTEAETNTRQERSEIRRKTKPTHKPKVEINKQIVKLVKRFAVCELYFESTNRKQRFRLIEIDAPARKVSPPKLFLPSPGKS